MEKQTLIILMMIAPLAAFGQTTSQKEMEKVAREMFRVITVNDRNAWISFMENNYTKSLQEKPVQRKLPKGGEKDVVIMRSPNSPASPLDAKASMFDQLHRDFGKGKLTSLKTSGNIVDMLLEDAGRTAKLKLTFTEKSPYQIDALAIEIED